MALSNENMFLLEFLVDDMQLEGRCDCMSSGEMCVSFQFLDNEPLDVCEGDFNGDSKKFGENGNSKTGKSCLFSLTPGQAEKVLTSFDLIVGVFKKMRPGNQPEKVCVGSARISVLPLFLELVSNPETACTAAKVLQETYNLIDAQGMTVGKIGVYIRMSCYGKMIVTQFQMNMNDKSVLFKDKDGHSLYRYKKSKKGRATKIEDMSQEDRCPPCPPEGYQQMNQQMYQQKNQQQQMYQQMNQPTFGQSQYPPPNPNCPMQPCFPNGPPPYSGGGMSNFPPNNPNAFSPPNQNYQMQPRLPDYGSPMQDMGMSCAPPRGYQQGGGQTSGCCGSGARSGGRSAGGGCCGGY